MTNAERQKKWREKNPEKTKEQAQRYYNKHKKDPIKPHRSKNYADYIISQVEYIEEIHNLEDKNFI